jgi:hypothetical protein
MSLKPISRKHFEDVLALPHEADIPGLGVSWYATADDQIVGEIVFDEQTQRWFGIVYAQWPDGWAEVDRSGRGFYDLDDAERSMMRAAAELQMAH